MKVFIGCGSNPKIEKKYLEETERVCNLLCDKRYDLVFGAYSKGMMGVCYNTFINHKREVLGISLEAYSDDLVNMPLLEVINYHNTFDRLHKIFESCNLFIIMPGGTGSLGELFGLMEEFKTNRSGKKIILYNYNHYYDNLIKFMKDNLNSGFMYEEDFNNLNIISSIDELEKEV